MNTYKKDANRLMAEIVKPENVGGFIDQFDGTEFIYAVTHKGNILMREAEIGCPEFKGTNWKIVESVPPHAEWVGQYNQINSGINRAQ
jgi:hypothetical protein